MKTNYQHLLSDKFTQDALKEIDAMLAKELDKPANSRDYDKIEELIDIYTHLTGKEEEIEQAAEDGIAGLQKRLHTSKPRISVKVKVMLAVACVVVTMLIANTFTVMAWDMDVFSVIVHLSDGSFSVVFPEKEAVILPTTEEDPYGIRTECAKHGMDVEAPTYLPEGFYLTKVSCTDTEDFGNSAAFWFNRGKKEVITIDYFWFFNNNTEVNYPCDEFNLSEIEINGNPAILSKEDEQYTIVWKNGDIQCDICALNVDYDECDKVVASLK